MSSQSFSKNLPAAPPARELDPLFEIWPAGKEIYRVHPEHHRPDRFNPGRGHGRFHPLETRGKGIPTLYGADHPFGALSETVFHDVPAERSVRRALHLSRLEGQCISVLRPTRDLKLIRLYDPGLGRLGLTHTQLIGAPPRLYPHTRKWALALYRHRPFAKGLIWVSKQNNATKAILLFGDRIQPAGLHALPEGSMNLCSTPGFELVCNFATEAGIVLTGFGQGGRGL